MPSASKPRPKDNPKTAYICSECRRCNREHRTHPGMMHKPGICDCTCRD